ncbi:MAG: hypothetical protein ACUVQG_08745 [Thermogutta sp.]
MLCLSRKCLFDSGWLWFLFMAAVPASLLVGRFPAVGEEIVLENDVLRYTIGEKGQNVSFLDRIGGGEQLVSAQAGFFLTIRQSGRTYVPQRCLRQDDTLEIQCEQARVIVQVGIRPRYLVFQVKSVEGDVEEIRLFNLLVRPGQLVSGIAGIAQGEKFAVAVRSLNLSILGEVHSRSSSGLSAKSESGQAESLPGQLAAVSAVASKEHGLVGASVVLVGCPAAQVRSVLQEALEQEGAVRSPVGGPWALDAPETEGSYVFATASEQTVDAWIDLAKRAGIAQIHLIGWEQTLGHYQPRKNLFPNGLDGLKQVVEKIHAAGLKAGMHTLTGCISPSDPWVTPKPDPRLAVDARFTLAAPLDEKSDRIVTQERPDNLDTVWAYGGHGNVLRIGDELIQYSGLAQEPPYGFTGCRRGAFGTVAQKHEGGASVEHLFVRYGCFLPDENSTLVDEIAEAIAEVYNTCGFDMIYMDGAEGMPGGWYGISRMREAIFRRLQRRTLVEASCWDYHSWAFHSRLGAWDHPNWGLKPFVDWHCRSNEEHRRSCLLPVQLGWWAILGPSRDHDAELPDEFEYLCVKSLAYGMPMSFQGIAPGDNPPCARQPEYLEMLGRYERLRLSQEVPVTIREQIKQQGQDFHLEVHEDGSWCFRPVDYQSHKVLGAIPESATWSVENRYPAQPLRVRIQALYGVQPYESEDGLELVGFNKPDEFSATAQAAGVKAALEIVNDEIKVGSASGKLSAVNEGNSSRGAWARFTRTFDPHINFQERAALGVWVHGDGSGALLNFQLSNPLHYWPTCDEHYVKLDFQGWRYMELLLRERDADDFHRYVWPYGSYYAVVYRSPLIQDHVSELNLYVNEVPAQGKMSCLISPIRALPVVPIKLANPTFESNGRRLTFPVVLTSGSYLEFDGQGEARVYDERGKLVQTVGTQGDIPTVNAGTNMIHFSYQAETPEGVHPRTKVTVITMGDPITE